MIQLVLKRAGTVIDVFGAGGEPLASLPLLGQSRGTVVPLRGREAEPLEPGHYRVAGWNRAAAQLELADLDLATETRLIDAGSARRAAGERVLDVRGIGAPTGGLGGRTGVAIHGDGENDAPPGGGLRVARAGLLRLIDVLASDPGHGTVVLSVAGEPYPLS
ncbi:MAG: hypothetical protein QOI11_3804 [Candidatus Eremiobacteraeota bacterium]|nr:hypothetical protein [Candidatus Eremiobacteraeota bacterium]